MEKFIFSKEIPIKCMNITEILDKLLYLYENKLEEWCDDEGFDLNIELMKKYKIKKQEYEELEEKKRKLEEQKCKCFRTGYCGKKIYREECKNDFCLKYRKK